MKFIRINEENGGDLIEKYDIAGFPTFALFKNGKMVDSKSGKMAESELIELIES